MDIFSNYKGPKSNQFKDHNQISVIIYWESIDLQIRMKAKIKKLINIFPMSTLKIDHFQKMQL